jgi:polysaccharide deacetylase 2 family uncharacterized protein YibQ
LKELIQKAEILGVAVGIGHAKEKTLTALKEMIPRIQTEGYDFVFASEVTN